METTKTTLGQRSNRGSTESATEGNTEGQSAALLCWLRGHHDARRPRLRSVGFCPKCGCPVGRDEGEAK